MKDQILLSDIISFFESLAPSSLQESYDNSGLQTGDPSLLLRAALATIDVTEEVIDEAIRKGANLIISHHPLIFGGVKRLTGSTAVEKILIKAIRNDIALLSIHTNLDNVAGGVNSRIAEKLGLSNCRILHPIKGKLRKLVTFIPVDQLDRVRQAIFDAGAGHIGNYDQCSFNQEGAGTFRGTTETHPFAGKPGIFHTEQEVRFETVYPVWKEKMVIRALIETHPYEEVAYDIYSLENNYQMGGAGITGELTNPLEEKQFLGKLKEIFQIPVIRHSPLLNRPVSRVVVCGGAGAFLLKEAIDSEAGFFITGDMKYHQFFDAEGRIVIVDVGHYESEQFTKELFHDLLTKKFPKFAVRLSEVKTNPVEYYL
jgi:dinuclear metal center YbgI/SA1388 family protein